jgi:hypothetical protein
VEGFLGSLRKALRRWLGIAAIQRQVRDLENMMAISSEDLERLNAATSRIAARVASLLDQIDALGTGNDDEVRAAQKAADIQQASADLRPLIEQLEGLGADAAEPVPTPEPEQVPVEPGPDVTPVENLPEAETPTEGTVVEPGEATPPGESTDNAPVDSPSGAPSDVPSEEQPRDNS